MRITSLLSAIPIREPVHPKRNNKLKSLAIVTAGATVFYAGVCVYKGNEKFYKNTLMPLTRYLPAEMSHNLAVLACKYKVFPAPRQPDSQNLGIAFFHKKISNPIGIAAGFDKQGEAVEGLTKLGFGFTEIGSVTPEPQPGNPTPRVFRLVNDEAIINRYGFNSEGHRVVFERLSELKNVRGFDGVLGVNLGKNKTSDSPIADYVNGVKVFGPIADYLVVNVSSPNTPGLRDLQGKKELEQLLAAIVEARNSLEVNNKIPILLKISPDISKQDIKDIVGVINKKTCRVEGLIVSNTTIAREKLTEVELANEIGGLSGAPLRSKSTQLIADIYAQTGGKIPIVGVGGISSGQDALEKLEAGASYLQLYTAFIYEGPPVVTRIKKELSQLLEERGYKNVQEAVGKQYKNYLSK
ncbi:dihydroorotate dehydrogenase (quinone), mitochondrial [Rhagoletis pomonella]|uniref:dihydroorotate dehydrogenase (quinone), mitochondrial n=1 Tax=Rhagoletis pomonella TaxID=28610 RepID=UPI001780978D|nr:dihydroorotate dehydrogenase (quinone), mitochondrial [Rhagoletis pomonella]